MTYNNDTYEFGVEHLKEELNEIDAQVDELQALHSANMLADRNTTSLYEEDVLALKENIGELRDTLEEVAVSYDDKLANKKNILERAKSELRDVRRTFHELRRQFFYQF